MGLVHSTERWAFRRVIGPIGVSFPELRPFRRTDQGLRNPALLF